jgi:biotin-dependent carboxylase-like uncharacterized protein
MGMTIINPGILSTVQDLGRHGYMDSGFSPSGALDAFSSRLANFLAGNPPAEAVLEMTLCGASMVFDSPAVIALTGADMTPLLNGFSIAMNRAFAVKPGDILNTEFARKGVRCYLAVAGGFDIEKILGSRSTNLKAGLGGFKGRKLQSKDAIPFRRKITSLPDLERRVFHHALYLRNPEGVRAVYTPADPLVLHVVEGKQAAYFTPRGITTFYNSVYTVQADSDRMGVRLDGSVVESIKGSDIVSDGIAPGAVQIPGSGKPIILLNDRQTTGGYAKIAAVITGDLWRLAQAPGASAIRFERIPFRKAEKLYIKAEKEIGRLQMQFTVRTDYGTCKVAAP